MGSTNMNKSLTIFGIIALLAVYCGGVVFSQTAKVSSVEEVRSKITSAHEIWLGYEKLKATPPTELLKANNAVTRQANQPPLPAHIEEVRRKITPSYEVWSKYEKLKYDESPAGRKAAQEATAKAEEERMKAEAEAERKRKEQYDRLVEEKNRASTEEEYQKLAEGFRALGNYENAVALMKDCHTEYNKLAIAAEEERKKRAAAAEEERKRKDQYDKLVAEKKYRASTEQHFQKLAEEFRKMIPYEDSEKLAGECNTKYLELKKKREDEAKAKAERERKVRYDGLVQEKNGASTEQQYQKLAADFRAMNGYKDSAKLAEDCDKEYRRLDNKRKQQEAEAERELKERYDRLVQEKSRASTEQQFQKLAAGFLAMNGYKDTAELAVDCNTEYIRLKNDREERERPVDLKEAIKASGFNDLNDFAYYGSNGLKNSLSGAKPSPFAPRNVIDEPAIQAEVDRIERQIKVEQDKIANTIFVSEYAISASERDIKNLGYGTFGVRIVIITGFTDRMVNVSPTFPAGLNVKVDRNNSGSSYGSITLFVTGNADSIQKLVKGADNYRAKVWFNHLRTTTPYYNLYAPPSADVTRIDIVAR